MILLSSNPATALPRNCTPQRKHCTTKKKHKLHGIILLNNNKRNITVNVMRMTQ